MRQSQQKVRIMHGNIIPEVQENKEPINFSMLHVNPDHFKATKDKYRQFYMDPPLPTKKEPWTFQKLWNMFQLEDVLKGNDVEIHNREGRRFFESHRRLRNQMMETKSVRPKTTSSSYRTKIQYIAYLQQFNG